MLTAQEIRPFLRFDADADEAVDVDPTGFRGRNTEGVRHADGGPRPNRHRRDR